MSTARGDETTLYIDWPGLARAIDVGESMYSPTDAAAAR